MRSESDTSFPAASDRSRTPSDAHGCRRFAAASDERAEASARSEPPDRHDRASFQCTPGMYAPFQGGNPTLDPVRPDCTRMYIGREIRRIPPWSVVVAVIAVSRRQWNTVDNRKRQS